MDLYIPPPTSSWTDGKMCLQRGIESEQMDDDDLASLSPPLLKQSFNTHHKQEAAGSKYREMSATPLVFNECRTTTDRGTLFHDTEGDDIV